MDFGYNYWFNFVLIKNIIGVNVIYFCLLIIWLWELNVVFYKK